MKKIVLLFIVFCFFVVGVSAQNVSVNDNKIGSEPWVRQMFMKNRTLPFSFKLDGKDSDEFLSTWKRSLKALPASIEGERHYDFEMVSPDKSLKLNCEIITFDDFSAAEWTLHFTNISGENTKQISNVNAANVYFTSKAKTPEWTLYTVEGTSANENDFQLKVLPLSDTTVSFRPNGGRSSSETAFPFYNLSQSGTAGVCIAIGWSGTWFSKFSATTLDKHISFFAGMEGVDLYLYPGESIRSPKVAIVQWEGNDRLDGNNTLRRFMLAHHSPRLGSGEASTPPLCLGFDFGDPWPCSEYESMTELLGRAIVERYRNFSIQPEVLWLDAGWYKGNNAPKSREEGRDWFNTAGTWECDTVRFPHGFRPLADDIHANGAKFMVWFEPERVYEGTKIFREHPEWLLAADGSRNLKGSLLFNLGNPEAREYLCKTIGDFIEENGIDYYRQDFNMAPAAYWANNDEAGRRGMTEIRHIEGLYAYWDYLLNRFPNMMIDNCASGGRRLDLETSSRAIPLWRTDCHYGEPTCQQSHEYGLSQFLPLHGTGVYTTDVYCTRSGLSSAYCWAGDIFSDRNPVPGIRKAVSTFKELRPYYLCDFYPLSGDSSTLGKNLWLAWQFHNPEDGSGIIQAFRRDEAPEETYNIILHGIDPQAEYEVFDYDDDSTTVMSGQVLGNLQINLPKQRSSKLLKYSKK